MCTLKSQIAYFIRLRCFKTIWTWIGVSICVEKSKLRCVVFYRVGFFLPKSWTVEDGIGREMKLKSLRFFLKFFKHMPHLCKDTDELKKSPSEMKKREILQVFWQKERASVFQLFFYYLGVSRR